MSENEVSMTTSSLSPTDSQTAASGYKSMNQSPAWPGLSSMRLRVHVQIPMPSMRVKAVMQMHPGQLLISDVPETNDVAFGTSGVQLAWCEFSIVDDRIGVRLTRPA